MNTANLPLKDLIVKLGKSQHLRADIFQNAFMNLLGWTVLFAACHIGITLPSQLSIIQATLIIFATTGAYQFSGKGKLAVTAIAFREFSGFLLNDSLYRREFLAGNNGLVIVSNHILGQLALVFAIDFSQMIRAKILLQYKIALILFVS